MCSRYTGNYNRELVIPWISKKYRTHYLSKSIPSCCIKCVRSMIGSCPCICSWICSICKSIQKTFVTVVFWSLFQACHQFLVCIQKFHSPEMLVKNTIKHKCSNVCATQSYILRIKTSLSVNALLGLDSTYELLNHPEFLLLKQKIPKLLDSKFFVRSLVLSNMPCNNTREVRCLKSYFSTNYHNSHSRP